MPPITKQKKTASINTKRSKTGAPMLKEAVKGASRRTKGATASKTTRVTIRYDVGINNEVYLRGSGARLSWTKGIKLKNVGPDTWVWETRAQFNDCEFKALINDEIFEEGENRSLRHGSSLEYSPHFEW